MTQHRLLSCGLAMALAIAAPAAAQEKKNDLLSGHDSSKPIDITSDSLLVEQNLQRATFIGKVDAVQGDMVLKTEKLVVNYAQGQAAAQPAAAGAQPAAATDANALGASSIRSIEAFDGVVITSPDETARGDNGVYDVVDGKIRLIGNVVLTRGQNVIKGTQLDMDLRSGVSKVTAPNSPTSPRVRAVFVPEKKPDAAPDAKPVEKKEP